MNKTVLITGKDTALGTEICAQALSAGFNVAATVNPENKKIEAEEKNLFLIPWNRLSPLSSKNVVMSVINRFGSLDEVFIQYNNIITEQPFTSIPTYFIEEKIDFSVKGPLFLTREILSHFSKKKEGSLNFVLGRDLLQVKNPIEAVEIGAFKAFSESIARDFQDSFLKICAFKTDSVNLEEFSRFIFEELNKKSSKRKIWSSFSDKQPFFSHLLKK